MPACHFHNPKNPSLLPLCIEDKPSPWKDAFVEEGKDTRRAFVRIGYDGRVSKTFRGHQARERFENEVLVLKHLEKRGCNFVPRVLDSDPEKLLLITTNCGKRVEYLSEDKMAQLFAEVELYGVRHEDRAQRNVTYRSSDGRFCLIDFEFATILDDPNHRSPVAMPKEP